MVNNSTVQPGRVTSHPHRPCRNSMTASHMLPEFSLAPGFDRRQHPAPPPALRRRDSPGWQRCRHQRAAARTRT